MFANRILIPFVLLALMFLYMTWEVDSSYSLWIIPCVMMIAILFVFAPQINWWWYKRTPPPEDPMVRTMLSKFSPFFASLSGNDKKKFMHRAALFEMATEFMPQNMESVPKDVRGLISASAIELTFGREEFVFPKFENIVVYPHPFPSPNHQVFHASETEEKDGVLLFSIEQYMLGFTQPKSYYRLGLHEFAKVFIISNPNEKYPIIRDDFWTKVPQISGLNQEVIEKWVGIPVEKLQVAIVHYFTYPEKFKQIFPEINHQLDSIFKPVGTFKAIEIS